MMTTKKTMERVRVRVKANANANAKVKGKGKEKESMVKLVVKAAMMERGKRRNRPWLRRKVMKRKRRGSTTRNHLSPLQF